MRLLTALCLTCLAATTVAAEPWKIFVFASPPIASDQFLGGFVSPALADSVDDLKSSMKHTDVFRNWGTNKREDAAFFVEVVGREEVNGEYRVHVKVTSRDGRSASITGASVHQWKQSADRIATQIITWVKANKDRETRQAKD